jgi:hypothetical protein
LGGGLNGSGTTNFIPKFTGSGTVGNSSISENSNEINITKVARQVMTAQASDTNKDGFFSHYTSDFPGYNFHALRYGNGIGGAIGGANESTGDGSAIVGNRRQAGNGHGGEFSRLESGLGDGVRGNQTGTGQGNGVSGIRSGAGNGHGGEFRREGTGSGLAILAVGDVFGTTKINAGSASLSGWSLSSNIARFGHQDFNSASNYGYLQAGDGSVFLAGASVNVTGESYFSSSVTASKLNLSTTSGSQSVGNATLVGGTVTVTTTSATANSVIMLTKKNNSDGNHALEYTTTNGSFTITSNSGADTSTVSYVIFN